MGKTNSEVTDNVEDRIEPKIYNEYSQRDKESKRKTKNRLKKKKSSDNKKSIEGLENKL